MSLNDVEKQTGTRNATIMMVFVGALHIYNGFVFYLGSIIFPYPSQTIVAPVMIVFGLLTLCASLIVWLQKPWATKVITVVGVAVCGTLLLTGFYLMGIILAPIYWFAIKWIRTSQPTEIPDWAPDWNED